MKITKKAEYALNLVCQLSQIRNGELISVGEVAEADKVSYTLLRKVAHELKSAGILNSHPGVSGGYSLAKLSSEITVSEVLKAVGEPIVQRDCCLYGNKSDLCESILCPKKSVTKRIQEYIESTFGQLTIDKISKNLTCEKIWG